MCTWAYNIVSSDHKQPVKDSVMWAKMILMAGEARSIRLGHVRSGEAWNLRATWGCMLSIPMIVTSTSQGDGTRRKDHLTTECRHSTQMPFIWKETNDSLHYRWHSCLNLHFENALSPSGLLCPLPYPCIQGLSGKLLFISDALSPPFWKRGCWSITSKEANEVQSCALSSVCLLHATLNLKCHQSKLLAGWGERNHSHTQKHLLQ